MDTKQEAQIVIDSAPGMMDAKRMEEKARTFGERYADSKPTAPFDPTMIQKPLRGKARYQQVIDAIPDADAKTAELKRLGVKGVVTHVSSKQELDVARAKKLAARASRKAERQNKRKNRR